MKLEQQESLPGLHSRRSTLLMGAGGLFALGLAGCAREADSSFKVVTTFTIIADMARNVAGDAATVEAITKVGAEIHNYQPTPGDLVKAQGADLILWNGLNLELWFEQFFGNLRDVPGVVVSRAWSRSGSGRGLIRVAQTRTRGCPPPPA